MAITIEVVEFRRTDPDPVAAHLRAIDARGDGEGWVNIGPALSAEEYDAVPHRSGLGAWFSGRGPIIPMATWTPSVAGSRPRAAQIGLAHGTGPNALTRLADGGLVLPNGWTKRQDHAKHGIVAELPAAADHHAMIEWLCQAMVVLSPLIEPSERWIAEVHRPGQGG